VASGCGVIRSSPPSNLPPRDHLKRNLLLTLALITVTLAVYAPTRTFEFVSFDDPIYVRDNQDIAGGLTWHGAQWAFTTGVGANWNPVTWFSHMLDVELFGLSSGLHHVTNVVIHTLNTLLLFALLLRMTQAPYKSAFVAALFAVHPLHIESVAWISERKDVLSTFFGLLAINGYVSYVRKPKVTRYLLMASIFALSLMSKPMLVTLPFVLLLLDVWPLGRVRVAAGQAALWRRVILEKAPLFVMAIVLSVVTFIVQSREGTVGDTLTFPIGQRLANATVTYVRYLARLVWPSRLAAFYPYEDLSVVWVAGSAIFLIATSFLVIRFSKRHPYLLVGWLWYLGTLVPVLGLIQAGGQSSADRYTYVPLIGILAMITWGVCEGLARWRYHASILGAAAIVLVATFAIAAMNQVLYWKDSYALWSHAVAVTSGNYLAHVNLGMAYQERGDPDSALTHFQEAVRVRPGYPESLNALGAALLRRGQLDEALPLFEQAKRIRPSFGSAHSNAGIVLARRGQVGQAIVEFMEGIRLDPGNGEMHANLGLGLATQGRFDEAIQEYNKAIKLMPGSADVHTLLGNVFFSQGKLNEAVAEFELAIELNPQLFETHNNLGLAFHNMQRYDEAIAQFNEAIRVAPNAAEAYNSRGVTLATLGKFDEAIGNFTSALRARPDYREAQENLLLAEEKKREAAR